MSIMNLQPGAMVMALKDLDPEGANVKQGDMGVVFAEAMRADLHLGGESGWDTGPCVRWTRQVIKECGRGCKYHAVSFKDDIGCFAGELKLGGVCNVYDGDVTEVKSE